MVRHILEKDWRLLWPLVTALAALQCLLALARFSSGLFLTFPTVPASLLQLLAAAAAIALAVHQDPVLGARQDWLVRPVPRRDLFLAKLLFVVVLVQGPWWITDLIQGVANGFPVGESAAAATACAAWVLLTVSVPMLAFGALTSTIAETVIAAIAIFAVVIAFMIAPDLVGASRPAALTGFAWVPSLLREAILLAAAASVLILQYRWRRTFAARALFAAALVAGLSVSFLPWAATYRLDQLLTASSRDAGAVAIAFAPDEGRFQPAPGQGLDDVLEKPGFGPVDVAAENQRRRGEGARTVFLPLHLAGLIPESRLLADRSEVRLIDRQGQVVYQGTGNDFELRATGPTATVHHGIRVPGALYNRIQAEPLEVRLDYWLTLFRANGTYALAAQGEYQRLPGIGLCATKVDDAGTRVLFQCLRPGERPACLAVALEHPPTRQRNPEVSLCVPEYSPYPGHTLPDALSRFGGRLPFYNPSGLIRYPVGGPELPHSRVVVTAFQATDHFVRHVSIPAVRLQDWQPQQR